MQISDNYHERKEHGTVFFPLAFYQSDENDRSTPWHWHEEFELSLMERGEIPCAVGSDRLLLKEGDALFINTGILHAQKSVPARQPLLKNDLVFHGRLLYGAQYSIFWQRYITPVEASLDTLPYYHFHADIAWEADVIEHIRKAVHFAGSCPFGYEVELRYHLSRVFVLICENIQNLTQKGGAVHGGELLPAKRMLKYIQEHYAEPITLKDLADCSSLCEREVQRTFRNIIHQSPIQYVIHYRIEKACQLLDAGDLSIIDICNRCGFSSPSYFSKSFKQIVGCQPREYRKA